MRVLVTADWHLRDYRDERYNVVRWILSKAQEREAVVIVAGDILDKGVHGSYILEEVLKEFTGLKIYAIRGNHDYKLSSGYFASENFHFIDNPEVVKIDGLPFMFIPYPQNISDARMAFYIEEVWEEIKNERWVLVSHGDWVKGNFFSHEDVYFPLCADDIELFSPDVVFLGHIHKPYKDENYHVFYPGSPIPIDRVEYGVKSVIEFDTDTLEIKYMPVEVSPLYICMDVAVKPINPLKDIERAVDMEVKKWKGYNVKAVDVVLHGISTEDKRKLEKYLIERLRHANMPLGRVKRNDVRFLRDIPDVVCEIVETIMSMAESDNRIDKNSVAETVWDVVSGISF